MRLEFACQQSAAPLASPVGNVPFLGPRRQRPAMPFRHYRKRRHPMSHYAFIHLIICHLSTDEVRGIHALSPKSCLVGPSFFRGSPEYVLSAIPSEALWVSPCT